MLDTQTKKRIDDCRDILVGKLPDPKAQIEQITIGLIYKFMDDMDKEAIELGGSAKFFSGDYTKYSWDALFDTKVTAAEMLNLYSEAIISMDKNPNIPQLFRDIFKNAFLPYRDPETLKLFLKTIGEFEYTHSEKLGDAFEYLLSVMGSQGDAGQFRTPRHIIDFLVALVDPKKTDTILDPACGTAGFLISAFKHIKQQNHNKLTPDEQKRLIQNFVGYDISPDMVRLSLVNLYLHGFANPHISEYDTLSSEERWNDNYDVVLANPPFMSPKGGIRPHKKFTIKSNRSEVLFVDYIAEHLNPKGRAGIIVPEGVIFQSGTAYKDLRKMLVDNYLYAVVSLPAGVFNPYSGVKTSILLMDKEFSKTSNEILFVKIDNDGFNLGAQRTAVKGGQLEEAIELLNQFKNGEVAESEIAHAVLKSEIAKNGEYNLSGDRYKSINILSTDYNSVKLGEVCRVINGRAYKQEELLDSGKYPVLRVGNFFSNRGWYYSDLELEEDKFCSEGDLLYAWSASFGPKIWDGEKCIYHYHIWKMEPDEKRINKKFLYHVLNKETEAIKAEGGRGIAMIHITKGGIEQREIPLPPLSVQEEIVAEIEGYQKIIDGATLVVENYKPKIDIDADWEMVELGELIKLSSGKGLTSANMIEGSYPVFGGNGINGYHNEYFLEEPTIVIGRVGAYCGSVHITNPKSWVTDNGLYVTTFLKEIELRFLSQMLTQLELNRFAKVGGQPSISQKTVTELSIAVPEIETQRQIVAQIEKEQELINANKQLIELFEQKIKDRIAKVWGKEKEVIENKNFQNLSRIKAEEQLKQFFIESLKENELIENFDFLASEFTETFFDDFFELAKSDLPQLPIKRGSDGSFNLTYIPKRIGKKYNWVIHDSELGLKKNLFSLIVGIIPALFAPGVIAVALTGAFTFLLNTAFVAFQKGVRLSNEQIQVLVTLKLLSQQMNYKVPLKNLMSALNNKNNKASKKNWKKKEVIKILESLQDINFKNGTSTKFVDLKDGKYWKTIDV